nr:hypothetical protein [Tanacetum cinerariifolium]
MARNKANLVDYQDFNGGPIAFGGSKGQITSKGKIRTRKLDYEDVYIMKELQHFNLFLVSQMCDKKNKVLFTDTKWLVLSHDFNLPDENQVLLRDPRQHNMYSFNLENIVPSGDLACLITKATVDESTKWHRRMTTPLLLVTKESNTRPPVRPREIIDFCGSKGIKREYSNARTPQQNESSYTSTVKRLKVNNGDEKLNEDTNSKINEEPVDQEDQAFLEDLEWLKRQENEANDAAKTLRKMFAQSTQDLLLQAGAARASSTNYVNTASTPVNAASLLLNIASTPTNQDDSLILSLEDIYKVSREGIFASTYYDDEDAVADFRNLETTVNVSPIPTSSYIQKQRRYNHKDFQHCLFACILSQIKPKKISQALEDESWVDAMQEEMLQFKIQKDERGVVVRNKARFVAQGHRHEEEIDYDEVFAPVARIEAIRIFLAFACYMGFIVYQMDVKSAFLYGKIDEEVYVSQSPVFIDPKFLNKVYKVVKALYGLHHAPRAWYATLSTFLMQSGYRRGLIDKTMFMKKDKKDIMLDKYVAEILKKFDFLSVKTASTPIETKKPLVNLCLFLVSSHFKTSHLQAVKRIFRKSTTGGCQFLDRRLISWQCKKETIIATLTTEAEYVAAASCCGQVLWIQNQMHHFIRDAYEKKLIQVLKIHIDDNVADLLTKVFYVSRIQALVDGKRVNIKEFSIRRKLRLDDAEGTSCLTNIEIFEGLAKLCAKTTSWNVFSSTMASAIICLATNQKFNFSRYYLLSLVKNIEASVPFFMFPRFVQLIINHQLGDMSYHKEIFDTPSLTKKVFANMKSVGTGFSGEVTPLFDNMLVQAPKEVGILQANAQSIPITNEPSISKPQKKHKHKRKHTQESKVPPIESPAEQNLPLPSNDPLPSEKIEKLEDSIERLEEENRVLEELKSVHSTDDANEPVMEKEKSSKQKRKIACIDADVLSMMDVNDEEHADVEEVLEVVKATKLMTEVITTARATKVSVLINRRGVLIQDPEETTTTAIVQPKVQEKDKGKAILIKEPKPLKGQAQIKLDEAVARQLEVELNADIN